ncbi:helix-turn-helix transcriptional regulator [Candidatus Kaiserbacteria bacterium]|nr:helix-turn-helix transcriptional regulator [Candidatus Kaiserbacteria bacterium]
MAIAKTTAKAKAKTKAKIGATKKKGPNSVDVHVGSKVRMRRMMLSMSQEKLGDALGLTFQQVQKYEKGTNRIGASRMQQLSHILQVPVSFFFEGAPVEFHPNSTWKGAQTAAEAPSPAYVNECLATPDGLALITAFSRMKDPNVRRSFVKLAESIAPEQEQQPAEHEVIEFAQAKRKVRK